MANVCDLENRGELFVTRMGDFLYHVSRALVHELKYLVSMVFIRMSGDNVQFPLHIVRTLLVRLQLLLRLPCPNKARYSSWCPRRYISLRVHHLCWKVRLRPLKSPILTDGNVS